MSGSPSSERASRIRGWLVRAIGPVALVLLLAKLDDPAEVWAAIAGASPFPLALAAGLNVVNVHLKVQRWEALLEARKIRYPRRRAYAAFLASLYAGMLTPGRVGDALRAQYLRRDAGVSYAEGLASVVADRLCDLYVLAAFVAVAVARYGAVIAGKLAFVTWAGVALTVLLPLLLLVPGVADRFLSRVYAKLSAKVAREPGPGASEIEGPSAGPVDGGRPGDSGMQVFLEALRAQVRPGLAGVLGLTVLTILVTAAQGLLAARALGLPIAFFDVLCLLAIANLLGLLPISISGLGVREYFYSLVFPHLGLAAAAGVSYGLVVFALVYLVLVAAGFVSWQIAPPPTGAAAPRVETDHVRNG